MAFTEKIRLIFDIDDKAAVGSFGRIGTSIKDAEGARGKFSAGLASTGSFLKANMAEAAMAAGAALVAFGLSSIKVFQDTALESGKFAAATGIGVEQASRLKEVAGDLGINMDSLQGAMLRFNKEVGAGKVDLKDLGTNLVFAKDGSIDAYGSFINAATAVGGIKDPTEQALESQRLFGRGYGEIAELMELDADELRTALGEVSEAKVIDKDELQKAKDMRAALDTMKDTVEDVQLQFGELLVSVAPTLEAIMKGIGFAAEELANFYEWQQKIVTSAAGGDGMTKLAGDARFLELAAKNTGAEMENLSIATGRVESSARKLDTTWEDLKGEIADDSAFLNMQGTFDDLKVKGQEAWDATALGAVDAEEKVRAHQLAVNAVKLEIIDYGKKVLGLTPEHVTRLNLLVDQGQIDEVERRLGILSRNRTMNLSIVAKGGAGHNIFGGNAFADGTDNAPAGLALVGEAGPELVEMRGGEKVYTAAQTRGLMGPGAGSLSGGNTHVTNVYTQADPNGVVAAIKQFERLNGRGWRS